MNSRAAMLGLFRAGMAAALCQLAAAITITAGLEGCLGCGKALLLERIQSASGIPVHADVTVASSARVGTTRRAIQMCREGGADTPTCVHGSKVRRASVEMNEDGSHFLPLDQCATDRDRADFRAISERNAETSLWT
ncbi:MAG TPA: hypothetical protein VHK24_02145, partial [Steroidobacter sp.]|nr:hypothetical protein [Steroidobacter sp.]